MSDTYIGSNGIDFIVPLQGFTKLYGIGGNDRLGSQVAGLALLDGGNGDDYLNTMAEDGLTFADFYGGNGNDNIEASNAISSDYIFGGNGDDIVFQYGEMAGAGDFIYGGPGRDSLGGGSGNDAIYGGDGDESGPTITAGSGSESNTAAPALYGREGDDYLDGGRGNDRIVGGLGLDIMVGGLGNDVFGLHSYNDSVAGSRRDVILDFKKGDKVDLSLLAYRIGKDLDFIGKKGFHDKVGEVRFKKKILQVDTNGDGKSDFEMKLDGVSKIKEGDLVIKEADFMNI